MLFYPIYVGRSSSQVSCSIPEGFLAFEMQQTLTLQLSPSINHLSECHNSDAIQWTSRSKMTQLTQKGCPLLA